MNNRPMRQMRRSPVRYVAGGGGGPRQKERSRSRGRKFKSPERGSIKQDITPSPKEDRTRRRSPSRNAKSPAKSPARRKLIDTKKSSPPLKSAESKTSKIEEFIRSSLTPDRAKIEEVVRSSVSRFEEVIAEAATGIKRRTTIDSYKAEKEEFGKDGLEQVTNISENIEIIEKGSTASSAVNTNNKNCNNFKEFGGLFGALILMVLMPSLVIISQLICTQDNCPLFPKTVVISYKRFFDLDAFTWYIGFLITQFLFSTIPLGPKIYCASSKGSDLTYRRNGPGSVTLTVLCLAAIRYFLNFQLIKVLDKTLPLLTTAIFSALSIIILLHTLPSKENRNPFAKSGNFIYDMWIGKYINPKWGPLDIKITLLRSCLNLIVVYNGLLVLKEIETKTNPSEYSVILIMMCTLQILLALDPLFCESSLTSSFTVTQEACGYYLIMSLAIIPFWITLIPKYLYSTKSNYDMWVVLFISSLHMIGHVIYRISCSQNDMFQRNPNSIKSSDMLYSRHPEKIYRGGLRSRIRYPEYSGLLLILFAWCSGCMILLPLHWVPISILIISLVAIIIHSIRMDRRSNIKHNLTWQAYTSSTTSALIPHIY